MADRNLLVFTCNGVPNLDRIVVTGASEPGAVRAKGDAGDRIRVFSKRLYVIACDTVPKPDGSIATPAGEDSFVRIEADASDRSTMSIERIIMFARQCLPYRHSLRFGESPTMFTC